MNRYYKTKEEISKIEKYISANNMHPLRMYLIDQIKVTVAHKSNIEKPIGFVYIDRNGECQLHVKTI